MNGAWSTLIILKIYFIMISIAVKIHWLFIVLLSAVSMVAGQNHYADQWVATEWILLTAHLVGGILLFVAARKKTFGILVGSIPFQQQLILTQFRLHLRSRKRI